MTDNLPNLRQKLASGTPVVGIWSLVPSPTLAEIIGQAGMDFQILDCEHGFYDLPALESSIRASEAAGCAPLVRLADPRQSGIQSALDLGAAGLLMPQLSSASAADEFLRGLKFGPAGTRGLNPFTRAGGYGQKQMPDDAPLSGVLLENRALYGQLDALLALPDLDFVYLGVYDMSVSLEVPGDVDHPEVAAFVADATARTRAAGKSVAVMAKTEAEVVRSVEMGANMIVYAVDTFVFSRALHEAIRFVRSAVPV